MKSLLSLLNVHLSAESRSDRFLCWWDSTRQRYPTFSDLDSVEALLSILRGGEHSPTDFARRDRLLRVLITEYRLDPGGCWVAALLLTYLRTIERASHRLLATRWGRLLGREEVESEAVRLFLELLVKLNLETNRDVHTSLTRRLGGQLIRWAQCEAEVLERVEHDGFTTHGALPMGERPARRRDGWELDLAQFALTELVARDVLDDRAGELLLGKVVHRRRLSEIASAPANSNRPLSYEATKKRVQRAEARIRAYLDSEELSLVELAMTSLEKIANSNVPVEPKPGSEEERNQR